MILPFSAMRAARRALEQDQNRAPSRLPFWRLVAGEIAVLMRRRGAARVWLTVAVMFILVLAVEVALSDATPGPALTAIWRWVVAAALSSLLLCAWAVVHAFRHRRPDRNSRRPS